VQQKLNDVMTPDPVTLPATATLTEAAACMADQEIGDVVVMDPDSSSICGVVTDRDIVVRALAKQLDPGSTKLGDICTRDLVTLTPEDSTEDAVSLMRTHAIRRIPVISNGTAVGIVSLGDLAQERDPQSALADISGAPPTD
jgi:CBS domain-containing protein